jgi:hypothetical protein
MKFVITVIIIVGLSLGAWQIYQYWGTFKEREQPLSASGPAPISTGLELPGMQPRLQSTLDAATQRGANGLRDFLATNRKTITDPRLAWIELDYVVLVAQSNPAEARKVFAQVKSRIGTDSPVYSRVKQLEKTYE